MLKGVAGVIFMRDPWNFQKICNFYRYSTGKNFILIPPTKTFLFQKDWFYHWEVSPPWYRFGKTIPRWADFSIAKLVFLEWNDFGLMYQNEIFTSWISIQNTYFLKVSRVWHENCTCHAHLHLKLKMGVTRSFFDLCTCNFGK